MPALFSALQPAFRNFSINPFPGLGPVAAPYSPYTPTTAQQVMEQYLQDAPQIQQPSALNGSGGGTTSSRNLANFNFGNVKTPGGGYAAYADRVSGTMGIGERVLRYTNAPERGWNAKSLLDITNIYAPRNDGNDPVGYANFLARRAGISPTAAVDFRDPATLAKIIQGISIMEHGHGRANITDEEALEAATRLIRGEKPRMRSASDIVKNSWGYR